MLLEENISEVPGIEKNISVETTDADGNSLMHIAAANGHAEVVRFLCLKGKLPFVNVLPLFGMFVLLIL